LANDFALDRVGSYSETAPRCLEFTRRQRVIRTKPARSGIYLRMLAILRTRAGPHSGRCRRFLELVPDHAGCDPSTRAQRPAGASDVQAALKDREIVPPGPCGNKLPGAAQLQAYEKQTGPSAMHQFSRAAKGRLAPTIAARVRIDSATRRCSSRDSCGCRGAKSLDRAAFLGD
jgi:hypothetical protein